MRVMPKVNVQIFNDAAKKEALFAPSDDLAVRTLDQMTVVSSGKVAIDEDNVPFTLPLGSVAAPKGIIVRCSSDFTIAFDGGDALTVRRPKTTSETTFATEASFYADATFSSVVVALPDGTTAGEVVFAIWGET